jgi:hypothetical protein
MKTETPTLDFTPEVLYTLGNVSALVNVHWYLGKASSVCYATVTRTGIGLRTGVPLNDSANLRMAIAEVGEAVLGDKLLGLQVGNEPDLYAAYVLFDMFMVCSRRPNGSCLQPRTSCFNLWPLRLFW